MQRLTIKIPIYLPDGLYRMIQRIKARRDAARRRGNLLGDRDIECSWILAHIPPQPGEALDFGNGGSSLGLTAAVAGYNVTAVDMEPIVWPYRHPRLRFLQGDILNLPLPERHFDLVINCSTVEHVGLAGRYSVSESREDGDIEAMARLRDLMKPDGTMLITIPVGRDTVYKPLHRIYGPQRLPRLFAGYRETAAAFWIKTDGVNQWVPVDRATALDFATDASSWDPMKNIYGLGGFVLRKL